MCPAREHVVRATVLERREDERGHREDPLRRERLALVADEAHALDPHDVGADRDGAGLPVDRVILNRDDLADPAAGAEHEADEVGDVEAVGLLVIVSSRATVASRMRSWPRAGTTLSWKAYVS